MAQAGHLMGGRRNILRMVMAILLIIGSVGILTTQPVRAISSAEVDVVLDIVDNGMGGVTISYNVTNVSIDETMTVRLITLEYGGATISLGDVQCDDSSNVLNTGQSLDNACSFDLPHPDLLDYTGSTTCGQTLTMTVTIVGESDSDPGDLTAATPLTFNDTCVQTSTSTSTTSTSSTTTSSTTSTTVATTTTTEPDGTATTLPPASGDGFEIFKSVSDSTVESGTAVTYSVTIRNNSANDAVLFQLRDNVGAVELDLMETATDPEVCVDGGGTPLSATNQPTITAGGGTFTCTFTSTITGAVGDVITDTVRATVDADVVGITPVGPSNEVAVTIIDPSGPTTTVAPTTTTAPGAPSSANGFSITKEAGETNPLPGGVVNYTVTISNNSGASADITGLVDSIAGATDDLLVDPSGSNDATCTVAGLPVTGTQTIAAGADFVCTFGLSANGVDGDVVTDTVTATIHEVGADPATATPLAVIADDASVTLTDPPPQRLAEVTKSDGGATVEEPGGQVTFTVTVTNPNDVAMTIVSLTDLVAGSSPVDVTSLPGSTCTTGGSLAPGGSMTCTFPLDVSGVAGTEVSDTVSVQLSDGAGGLATASASESTPILASTASSTTSSTAPSGEADVTVTKTASVDSTTPGGEIEYRIRASNAGPATATGLTVTDTLPDSVTFVRAQGNGWSCTLTGQRLDCNSAPLDATEASDLLITVQVNDDFAGTSIVNTAIVDAEQADSATANNSDDVTVSVAQVAGTSTSQAPTTSATVVVGTGNGGLPITGPRDIVMAAWGGLIGGLGLLLASTMSVWRQHHQGIALALPTSASIFTARSARPGRSVNLAARAGALLAWGRHFNRTRRRP